MPAPVLVSMPRRSDAALIAASGRECRGTTGGRMCRSRMTRATQAPPVRADTGALVSALEAHITTLKTELTCERAARHAARAASDKATAELVELARRLAAITETQTSTETAEVEPRSKLGRAWGWFLRN